MPGYIVRISHHPTPSMKSALISSHNKSGIPGNLCRKTLTDLLLDQRELSLKIPSQLSYGLHTLSQISELNIAKGRRNE